MTTITTHNPVRSDVPAAPAPTPRAGQGRGWALAGVGAGLAGIGTIVTSSAVSAVYDEDLLGDAAGIAAKLETQAGWMFAFHSITVVGALLTVIFAAGLYRRLAGAMPDSSVPLVAFAGLFGTAVVSVLGSGLDTEFMMSFAFGDGVVAADNAAMYNHWIGTIPWVWVLSGLTGTGLYAAARRGVVPRWIGRVGLVLGGLTLALGISPLEYMAAAPGALWLLATAAGFAFGDRA
ncbi:hypothetical protein DDE18_14840 [Nocardioides gansuensis]|uniref:DUF4386 domain-containing protein n=1 Tax=Nocardioides gansuensis TaxID=2138300 RepID=A0A2T8F8D0_9ACTN|nr:hypothetical protein [Nocardioides gansuensis]PVG81972.1 hypothetical protein DDE18_14840 [Nocardioides gansuensis]